MKEAEIALNEAQIEIQSLREDVEILSAKTDEANLSSDFIDLIDSSAILVEAKNPEKVEELKSIFSKDRNALETHKLVPEKELEVLTTKARNSVSEDVHSVLSKLTDKQTKNLLDNSNIAANNTATELNEMTTKAESSVSQEAYEVLSGLTDKQTKNLLDNSDIAANKTATELNEMTTKNISKTDPRHELAEKVTLSDLKKLADGKMEEAGNNWPPIISLADAENFSFTVGSAQLTNSFEEQLKSGIADQILETLIAYEADVIEVIGHTDLQKMQAKRITNLDDEVLNFFKTDKKISLEAKDNAGLGYARALSVAKLLSQIPTLRNYTILPYSGAQMITPEETINNGENSFEPKQLRRIEIRVRRKSN